MHTIREQISQQGQVITDAPISVVVARLEKWCQVFIYQQKEDTAGDEEDIKKIVDGKVVEHEMKQEEQDKQLKELKVRSVACRAW